MFTGSDQYPSKAYGVYLRSGKANYRTVYEKPDGWKITYGCVGTSRGGDTDAWYVTSNGKSSGAVLYAPYKVTCPSDSPKWWYKEKTEDVGWSATR